MLGLHSDKINVYFLVWGHNARAGLLMSLRRENGEVMKHLKAVHSDMAIAKVSIFHVDFFLCANHLLSNNETNALNRGKFLIDQVA